MSAEELIGQELLSDAFKFLEVGSPRPIKQYFKTEHTEEESHFQLSPYEKKAENAEEDSLKLLEPEHPLLVKFQQALKGHLERQIEHINNEIFEYETAAKKKHSDKDQLGVDSYETQQIVSKQQSDLEDFISGLENISAARQETEVKLNEALIEHKEERMKLFETEKQELELRREMDSVNLLVQQMTNWEDTIESELKVNQRVFEKTKKDKTKLAEEKRKQDMLVYKLMTDVWNLETELETMCMQLRVKEEEREKLAQTVAMSNTDIEAGESEHRCLLHGWHSVIVAISNRDKHFNQVNQELHEQTEKLRSVLCEIDQVKKLAQREMNQNENLTMFRNRIESDLSATKHQLELEESKRDNVERNMMQTQAIIDQTECDFRRVAIENQAKTNEVNYLFKEYEKLSNEKVNMESSILMNLQDHITNDKASKYLGKILNDLRVKKQAMEIGLSNTENRNAMVLMDIECRKGLNDDLERHLAELKKLQSVVDKEISDYTDEIKRCYSAADRKQREIEVLSKRLDKIKSTGFVKSPHDMKISALEQHIEHVQEKNKNLQSFWMREQGHVVCLTEQRQEQIHDSNLLRKQTMILEQRNLKINDELEMHRKQKEKMIRSINKLQNQLVYYTEALNKKKGSKNFLDESNMILQNEFVAKLQDEELAIVKIETDIVDGESDIRQLSKDLLDKNREALEWEKKYKMVLETKDNINVEKGEGGEVGNMRAEIHRMNVRYSQLKKGQDKLIGDLEHCVARRDAIVTNAEAREKRVAGVQSQVMFTKKLDDMRNKTKVTQSEIEETEETIDKLECEMRTSQDRIGYIQADIASAKVKCMDALTEIEDTKTDKQMNLEMVLMQQRKYKMYSELAKGRQPFLLYKSDAKVQMEYSYQRELNTKLQRIVDSLMTGFPLHYHMLLRLANTLKLSVVSM